MSENASHFKNHVMNTLPGTLRVEHRFAVANSPWSNGNCERMMREVVRTLKAILREERRDIRESVDVMPKAQQALNTAYRDIHKHTVPRTGAIDFSASPSSTGDRRRLESGCTR